MSISILLVYDNCTIPGNDVKLGDQSIVPQENNLAKARYHFSCGIREVKGTTCLDLITVEN